MGCERAVYTVVTGRNRPGTCTWPGRPTCHVHDGPCTRPCTWPVYMAVYWPCTRPCIWRVHGLVTAVYTYACVHGCVHGRERAVYTAAYGPCRTVLTAVYVPCTGTRAVYTARGQRVTTIFFAKDTFYAEAYSYKSITFKKLGQLALLAPRCGGQEYYVQCS